MGAIRLAAAQSWSIFPAIYTFPMAASTHDMAMRSFIMSLARLGGDIARRHFRSPHLSVDSKGRGDYVSHVDRQIEDAIATRIRALHPDHRIIGEEAMAGDDSQGVGEGPCWIIDPIDGTTNFIRGIASFAISIAYCHRNNQPQVAVVYDPIADEMFIGERGAGLWVGSQRVYSSGCANMGEALVATAMPFRVLDALDDCMQVWRRVQPQIDDMRRSGSAALDLAYVAVGRIDAYYELGIWCWDTAAGELLVRCGGGAATDFNGKSEGLLSRRSIVAAATPALHAQLLPEVSVLASWLHRDLYRASSSGGGPFPPV
ncbi:MAG: inositol monophosphatase [Planctomycetota bacterium]|nr:MAG: inositol monophosphatase [Planctomycetota bacterium]